MAVTVDARGLSCPQPVIMILDQLKKGGDNEIIVLVDTETSRENVIRAVQSQGCQVNDVSPAGHGYCIVLSRG
ncbi:MAG: sulfurtransferase TusA family protein [Desulfopila sp.]